MMVTVAGARAAFIVNAGSIGDWVTADPVCFFQSHGRQHGSRSRGHRP